MERKVMVKNHRIAVCFYNGRFHFKWNGKSWFSLNNLAKALGVTPQELRRTVRA